MIVGVTGGTGFIGRRLIRRLSGDGHIVRVLTRRKRIDDELCRSVELYHGDLLGDADILKKFIAGIDVLYHCAGEIRREDRMHGVHVGGTENLLRAAKDARCHWVQLSSIGAYGPPRIKASETRTVTEEDGEYPVGVYELTKTESDRIVAKTAQNRGMSYTILRPSTVFGREMPNQSLLALVKAVKLGYFFYIGKPGAIANYIHVDDVVDALVICGADRHSTGQIYNLSYDCPLEDLISGISSALGVSGPRIRLPEGFVRAVSRTLSNVLPLPLTEGRINALVGRTSYPTKKIEEELNYRPARNVPDVIGELIT